MLSLRELRRAARILREYYSGCTVRRIVQPGEQELILVLDGHPEGKVNLLVSGGPEHARVCLVQSAEPVGSPGSFYEYARAHLPGTALSGADVPDENRELILRLSRGAWDYTLILSLLGSRSNLYLLDADGRIVHSLRPLEDTRRELSIGGAWAPPPGNAPHQGIDRWEDVPDHGYLAAVGQFYAQAEQKRLAERLARRIGQALKKERAFLERKSLNLQQDLGEARQAEKYRHVGELLKSVLHTIRPGDEAVKAVDYSTGEVHEIPLDPRLSPAGNLEAYFARYQKESRGVRMIEQQLEELEAARAEIESIEALLARAVQPEMPDIEALQEIASRPKVARLLERQSPRRRPAVVQPKGSGAGKRAVPARLLPKRYRTRDGLEIWVGRSDEGNDYLTTKLARGNDLFFHLEGYPGSHVILRTEGRTEAPPKSILDACELAVHFSKLKNAGNADVHVAPVKDVKKPKGAKPGLVYVRSGRTVHLRRDAGRLQSILASRLDQ